MPHWNDQIPRDWSELFLVDDRTWGDQCVRGDHRKSERSGIYRLIGLAADSDVSGTATIDRICGRDRTGTLYIGHAEKSQELCGRLGRLVRSLRKESTHLEHGAAKLLRQSPLLSEKFPSNRLAITWSYADDAVQAEKNIIATYADSFGEAPPLNRQRAVRED